MIIRNTKIEPIIKGELKLGYYEPRESRQVIDDCECDESTINYQF
jgi:hypothetical protein